MHEGGSKLRHFNTYTILLKMDSDLAISKT